MVSNLQFVLRITTIILLAIAFIIPVSAVTRDGRLDPGFAVNPITINTPVGKIFDIEESPDGKLLVSGTFPLLSGYGVNNLARLHSNGLIDTTFNTGAGPNDKVEFIFLRPDGDIYISGDFTQYNGVARNKIARLNSDGSLDTGFTVPDFGNQYFQIRAIQPDGKIIVNGLFTTVNSVPRNRIARLNTDGSLDTSFDPGAGLPNGNQIYEAVIQPDGKILLAGRIISYGGVAANGIVRLNSDGSRDASFNSGVSGSDASFYDMALRADGKIYICGEFNADNSVLRLNSDGSIDNTFNTTIDTGTSNRIWSLIEQSDGKVLIGGEFGGILINGVNTFQQRLFRFNADGSRDASFTAQAGLEGDNGEVNILKQQGNGQLLLGGDFRVVNGTLRAGIARIDVGGNIDNAFFAFTGAFTAPGFTKMAPDGKFYVGGNFELIGLTNRANLARMNADGTLDTSFQMAAEISQTVYAIAFQPDGKILVAGSTGDGFFSFLKGLWRLNPDGSIDSTFNAQIPTFEAVNTIVVQPDNKILIGGSFNKVNNINRTKIARLNPDGSLDTAFNPNFSAFRINTLVLGSENDILVGGNFTAVNSVATANIVRLKSDGTTDTSFNVGAGTNGEVETIYVAPDAFVFIGGSFAFYRGASTGPIVKTDKLGVIDTSFRPVRTSSTVTSILPQSGGRLLIAGNIQSQLDASRRAKILRVLKNGVIDYSFDTGQITQNGSAGLNTYVNDLGFLPDGNILASGVFNAVNGLPRWGVMKIIMGQRVPPAIFDFEGDGKSDIVVFRPETGAWYRSHSYLDQIRIQEFGAEGDKPVPADYDGDFITDTAIFRPSHGGWYIQNSSDGSYTILAFGIAEDIPVPGDFDGDGRADIAVFRPSSGVWYIQRSRDGLQALQFGASGDKPSVGDFDGDGITDIAIFRPANGAWYLIKSSDGSIFATIFGQNGDIPVQGDYDGDFIADFAVFRPANGTWYLLTGTAGFQASQFGASNDKPVPADYDGDGKMDIAVFRAGVWYVLYSGGGLRILNFGAAGDIAQTN